MNETMQAIFDGILDGDRDIVRGQVTEALSAGMPPATILNESMIAAMAEVGRRFEIGEYFVPEMLIAARAMKEGLAILKPRLLEAKVEPIGRVVLGTVKGDLHDIGKNLVGMMLEGAGFEVIDLGTDVAPDQFVETVKEKHPQIVGLSALLTTTMPSMRTTIQALEATNTRGQVKVMIGGAPVTQKYADEIGADAYASDASSATARARALLGR